MQQWRAESGATTFDEASMERSKSFVKALQELKNLRPQLYSAAEYCEKSYLHNDQKQLVLDNLKDYAARALINAVDHIGSVAHKLSDLFGQQTLDVSTVEMKISCLSQHILVCQNYADKEGLRQQEIMLEATKRYHKHYTMPSSFITRVDTSKWQADYNPKDPSTKPHPHTSGTSGSKTLSWLLASEANSTLDESREAMSRVEDLKVSKVNSDVFHLLADEQPTTTKKLSGHVHAMKGNPDFDFAAHPLRSKETMETPKPIPALKPSGYRKQLQVYHHAGRNRSMLAAFFTKNKMQKSRTPVTRFVL